MKGEEQEAGAQNLYHTMHIRQEPETIYDSKNESPQASETLEEFLLTHYPLPLHIFLYEV